MAPLVLGEIAWRLAWAFMTWLVAFVHRRRVSTVGKHATYHHVSFSFLMATLIEAAAGCSFRDALSKCVLTPLKLCDQICLGEVPPSYDGRLVRIEPPPCGSSQLIKAQDATAAGPPAGSVVSCLLYTSPSPRDS